MRCAVVCAVRSLRLAVRVVRSLRRGVCGELRCSLFAALRCARRSGGARAQVSCALVCAVLLWVDKVLQVK